MQNKQSIAILGSKGFVGSFVSRSLQDDYFVEAFDYESLDITNEYAVSEWFKQTKADVVINFVAYTDVDKAEEKKELANKINTEAAGCVARMGDRYNKFLIHTSTDMIFPGTQDSPGPYKESDQVTKEDRRHIGWYAKTKFNGELAVKNNTNKFAIVRLILPFGNAESEKDLVRKTINVMSKGYALFEDQFISHTYLPDLVKLLGKLINTRPTGIYHCSCKPVISAFEFGSKINKLLGNMYDVKAGSIHDYLSRPGVALRPYRGGLDTTFTQKELGVSFHEVSAALSEFVPLVKI